MYNNIQGNLQTGSSWFELKCVDSYISLRAQSDIDCAIFTSRNISYDYAFTVRGGRCYACHTLDTLRPHNRDEVSVQGPHYIAGETFIYSLTALFDYGLEELKDIHMFTKYKVTFQDIDDKLTR